MRGVLWTGGLLLLAGAAAGGWVAAPALLRPGLEAALTRGTGHAASVGDMRLAWAAGPVIEARDVTLANAPWGSRPDMLVASRVRASVDLSAVLSGVVRIVGIDVQAPNLLLETDAAGHDNWERPASPESPGGSPVGRAWLRTEVGPVTFRAGRLALRDGRSGRAFDGGFEGVVDPAAPVRGARLAITGRATLPEPVDVAIQITPGEAAPAVSVKASGVGAQLTASGLVDPVLLRPVGPVTLDAHSDDMAAVAGRFGWRGFAGAGSLHAAVTWTGESAAIRGVRLVVPAGEITGDLDVTPAPRPTVRGTLRSPRLDLDALHAAAVAPAAPSAQPASGPPAASPHPEPPSTQPWAKVADADVDVALAVADLEGRGVVLRDVAAHLVSNDGDLRLDPVTANGPGGHLEASLHADAAARPPSLSLSLRAPALAMAPVMAALGAQGGLTGTAAVQINGQSAGESVAALRDNAAGQGSLVMGDGDLDLQLLAPLLAATHLPVGLAGRAHLRCLVVRGDLKGTVLTLSPLLVDATRLLVQGSGAVDLDHRTLSLHLRPLLRTGPGIVVPVLLTGPWARPHLQMEPAGATEAVLGALTGSQPAPGDDACAAAGVAAAPLPAGKPPKTVDFLRSLFR